MLELCPDHLIDNRYRLIRVIGAGTFGTVWSAEHLALRASVAVKVLEETLTDRPEARERFLREAWAASALRSPHVVQILDCGEDRGAIYIAMELLQGESLEQRLATRGRLDVVDVERIVRHVGRAIDRARTAGIIHRDLKPGNVFVEVHEGEEVVKVLDFGIAKFNQVSVIGTIRGVTPTGVVLGTPQYMSPEQARGASELDYRTDLWSLGIIAFECLLGRPAFDGPTPGDILAAIFSPNRPIPSQFGPVPPGFDEWFAKICAWSPSDRYASGKLAADEFARLCELPTSGGPQERAPDAVSSLEPVARVEAARREPAPVVTNVASPKPVPIKPGGATSAVPEAPATFRASVFWLVLASVASVALLWIFTSMREGPTRDDSYRPPPARVADAPRTPITESTGAPSRGAEPEQIDRAPSRTAIESVTSALEPEPPARVQPATSKTIASAAAAAAATEKRPPVKSKPPVPKRAGGERGCDPPWSFDRNGQPKAKPYCL